MLCLFVIILLIKFFLLKEIGEKGNLFIKLFSYFLNDIYLKLKISKTVFSEFILISEKSKNINLEITLFV